MTYEQRDSNVIEGEYEVISVEDTTLPESLSTNSFWDPKGRNRRSRALGKSPKGFDKSSASKNIKLDKALGIAGSIALTLGIRYLLRR